MSLRRSVPLAALAFLVIAQGAAAQRANERALHDPTSAFWREHAPAVYRAEFETTKGSFTLEVTRALSPLGADRFYNLVRAGYYDDSRFTRAVPNFIVQFGVPKDSTLAALWYHHTFPDDSVKTGNVRGTFAFAMRGPNDRTTQIYINLVDNSRNDAQGFSPLGRVVDGMGVVDSLYNGYGETSGGGVRAGKQGPLLSGGNAFVDREYPKLDHLIRATIVRN
ncbi:MAG: peptidylprolyl isomerase [Gemmatimonadaceae bacterium]